MKKFFAVEKAETESQGSQFQRNAAAFLDAECPASGERLVTIDKNAQSKEFNKAQGNSVLNAERLKEHVSN